MKYITDTDYNYIMNKYHDPKTHDNTRISRFMRHDEIFDENIPFTPSKNEDSCKFCELLDICNKELKN